MPDRTNPRSSPGDRFKKGDRAGAFLELAEAVRINPRSALCYEVEGNYHARVNQPDKAVFDFSEAIVRDPTPRLGIREAADCYARCGKFEQAIADLDKARELNPILFCLPAERGRVYLQQGESDKALNELNKAVELRADDANNFASRGLTLVKMAMDDARLVDLASRSAHGESRVADGGSTAANTSDGSAKTPPCGAAGGPALDPSTLSGAAGPPDAFAASVFADALRDDTNANVAVDRESSAISEAEAQSAFSPA